MKKQLIACAVTLSVAATASASEISAAMKGLLTDLSNVEISQTGTSDAYRGVKGATSRAGQATGQDATDAGQIVLEQSLQPTNESVIQPAWSGTQAVATYIVQDLPADVSSAATNVGVALQISGLAASEFPSATADDATDLSNADVSNTGTADAAEGVSGANSFAQTGASAVSAGEFSSDPMEKIEEQKARNARVKREAQASLQRASFYGVDTVKGMEELTALGYYSAAETGVEVNDEEALAVGILVAYSI